MSIACLSVLIVKFHDHQGQCGSWIIGIWSGGLDLVFLSVNSAIACSTVQDERSEDGLDLSWSFLGVI